MVSYPCSTYRNPGLPWTLLDIESGHDIQLTTLSQGTSRSLGQSTDSFQYPPSHLSSSHLPSHWSHASLELQTHADSVQMESEGHIHRLVGN